MAAHQRKFPLCAKLQMEDLPMETLAGVAELTQSAAKDKNPLVGTLFPFLMGEHKPRVVLVEVSHGAALDDTGQVLTTSC